MVHETVAVYESVAKSGARQRTPTASSDSNTSDLARVIDTQEGIPREPAMAPSN
jgi:hypothetical protein